MTAFGQLSGLGRDYLELRCALKRARAEARNAPADPTRPRTTVGFSGEFTQPPWAFAETVTASIITAAVSRRVDFFILILNWKVTYEKFVVNIFALGDFAKNLAVAFLMTVPEPYWFSL